ncbi:MAG: WG repeat-containing protein [Bacteroidetes bacterium]|nr:WG repeat-containing protein [Bacteroidota bacterium]
MKSLLLGMLLWPLMSGATDYQTFEENGKVGIKDSKGVIVLPPKFDALGWSDGSFSVVGDVTGYRQNGLWGIINLKKPIVAAPEFESLVYASGDYLIGRKKTDAVHVKSGCINLAGEIKIPFIYDGVSLHGLRAIVFILSNARYQFGLVDLANRIIIPLRYKSILPLGTLRYAVENEQEKIALFSEEGKNITDFLIDSISPFYKNYAIVYQRNLQGLIDREGTFKTEIKYSSIEIRSAGKVKVRLPSQWLCIDEKNEIKKIIQADELQPAGKDFLIKRGLYWGLLEPDWSEPLGMQYEALQPVLSDQFIAKQNGKYGVIDKSKTIIPFLYDSIKLLGTTLKIFTKGIGWQLCNNQGKIISERYYQQINATTPNAYPAQSAGYWGLLGANGKEILHCVFDSLKENRGENWSVKFKGQYGVVNTKEDWLVPPQARPLQLIRSDIYLQKESENFLIKSFSGSLIYFTPNPLKFESDFFVEKFSDGREKKIDYTGQWVQPVELPRSADFYFKESEGLQGFKKDGRFGFIDENGKLRIANRYDSIDEFHEGLAAVKLIGKWGFVNTEDRIAVNPNYDEPARFYNGVAIVSHNQKKGVINRDGKIILPFRYERIERKLNNKMVIVADEKKGLANVTGEVLIEPRFDFLQEVGNGTIIVCAGGKWGTVSEKGVNLIPMMYDNLVCHTETKLFLAEKKSAWKEIDVE